MAELAGIYALADVDPAVVANTWRELIAASPGADFAERGRLKVAIAKSSAGEVLLRRDTELTAAWGYGATSGQASLDRAAPPWVRCDYDVANERAVLRADRYGFALLYWRQIGAIVAFSSSAALLARLPPSASPDPHAIAELVAFDQLLGERSFDIGVSALPAGYDLVLEPSGAVLRRRFSYCDLPLEAPREPSAVASELIEIWRASMRELLPQPGERKVVVPLSGGLDSRLLAASAIEHGAAVETFTFGQPAPSGEEPPDVSIARQVASTLGAPWRMLSFSDGWLAQHAERTCRLTDGHLNILHSAGVSFTNGFRGNELRLDGLAGDIVLGGSAVLRDAFEMTSFDARLERLWRARSSIDTEGWRHLLRPAAQRELARSARASLASSLRSVTADLASDDPRWGDFWILRNRIRRFTTNGALLWRPAAESTFPFFAPTFLDRLLALPPRLRLNGQLQARFMREGYPAMARIPWQKTGRPLPAPGWLGAVAHHLRPRSSPPKVPFFDFDAAFRRSPDEREFFRDRLLGHQSGLQRLGLFDEPAVARLLDAVAAGKTRGMQQLASLVTLSLVAEQYGFRSPISD